MFASIKQKLCNAHRSLTIWFNAIIGSVLILLPEARDAFPQLQAYLTPESYNYGMRVLVIGNILLRFKTTLDLADKGKPNDSTTSAS